MIQKRAGGILRCAFFGIIFGCFPIVMITAINVLFPDAAIQEGIKSSFAVYAILGIIWGGPSIWRRINYD